ncbi:MAG: CBS domain-containing protein [Longimicrobiales bacterium]|nr:CBS domain-containing protein [Longimicrobiales bacterium]
MGSDLTPDPTSDAFRQFTKAILRDLQALEVMLDRGMIESGVRRIGAEQEVFLVDQGCRPAPVGVEVLERLGAPFTSELARFNLELNLAPLLLRGDVFSTLEARLNAHLARAQEAAAAEGARVALAGVLPTLTKSDLRIENITPRQRYYALNDAVGRMLKGQPYRLRIEGTDELHVEHDSVMLEACNTSCQVHLQVSAEEFAPLHNVAQAVTGPVLAAAVNSPLLFGRRLWSETRIALFQQSLDTRSPSLEMRELSARVRFGDHWIRESVVELFQEDIARFRVLLAAEVEEDPLAVLKAGGIPRLEALQLFNGTVYRWNRPCYGISEGKPHLRIECRALPSGPSVVDEVANAAFWLGTVMGVSREYGDVTRILEFDDARANFAAAAKLGLKAGMYWKGGVSVAAPRLILETLLPLAREGLRECGVDADDVERYLTVIHDRVKTLSTGARWALRSLSAMKDRGTRAEQMAALTASMLRNQEAGTPVHTWEPADPPGGRDWEASYHRVEQYMTTHLFTVHEEELIDLVAFLMDRKQIRHVLVEDDEHRLTGIVSYRSLLRLISQDGGASAADRPVREVMETDPVTATPETTTLEAIELLRRHRVSCLPVVRDGRLVGIVSERDFMPIAYHLLEERLGKE